MTKNSTYGPEEAQRALRHLRCACGSTACKRVDDLAAYIRELEKAEEALAELKEKYRDNDKYGGDNLDAFASWVKAAERILGGEKKEG